MLYLNKLLLGIKKDSLLFKSPEIVLKLGISSSQIKELKKYALENQLITQQKQEFTLTTLGEDYLVKNPIENLQVKSPLQAPNINVEYLKLEKTPAILTKAIRALGRYFIEKEDLKEFSLEQALFEDIKRNEKLKLKIEKDILNGKRNDLEYIFEKYINLGLTKSLVSILLLVVLTENNERIAIYERAQFQLKLDSLMFDRMFACPQNFELQRTEMPDEYILKDVSKIILNKKTDNILEITKGLFVIIKNLEKYTLNTQNLTPKTLRFRNVIMNAKDPISLFERDIPRALGEKSLKECDREFLNNLKISLNELKNCYKNLVLDLGTFIFKTFDAKAKTDLSERFLAIKEFIGDSELKILLNTIIDVNVSDDLWINRVATYINKLRVPKDWSDEDYADFKVKTKELSLKFALLETTVGTTQSDLSRKSLSVLNDYLDLTKIEQINLLRKMVLN